MDERKRYKKRMKVRRAVLGAAHDDRARAKENSFSKDIQEVLLQAAIYCGVPAANTAFPTAEKVFAETEK
jgi:alkylhydroperoxidase/carboxymuconolactone decarboxylase family protein YurZ